MLGEARPKYEYPLSYRKGSLLSLVVGEDKKWVLKHLPVALPKHEMGLVFGFPLLEIVTV